MNRRQASCVLALMLSAPAHADGAAQLKAGSFDPPHPAPTFTLDGSDGKPLALHSHRGKLVLLAFGFTHCPAVCPTTLATLAEARRSLGASRAAGVQVLFVTVDPQRDDAARMRAYLASFDESFLGGTGTPPQLAAVHKAYGVTARRVEMPGNGYAVDHSSSVFMIDREGRLRALMPYGRGAADYAHDIALLLK